MDDLNYDDLHLDHEEGGLFDELSMLEEDNKPKPKTTKYERSGCIAGHLASPINEIDCEFILNNPISTFKGCSRHYKLKQKVVKEFGDNVQLLLNYKKDPIAFIQDWIKQEDVNANNRLARLKDSVDNLLPQKMNFLRPVWKHSEKNKELLVRSTLEIIEKTKAALDDLKPDLEDMMRVERIKDKICFKDILEGNCITYRGLHAEPDVCFLTSAFDPTLMFSTNLLLCALDKLQSRFNLLLYCKVSDIQNKYEGFSIYQRLTELLAEFETLRGQLGQDFFEVMNNYESLVIGWVVQDPEDLGCKDLFENAKSEITEILTKHAVSLDVIDRLLPPIRADTSSKMALELTGIVKCLGYPCLDARVTLGQVKKFGIGTNHEISMDLVDDLDGMARREFCYNYYKKHSRLPIIRRCPADLSDLMKGKLPPTSMFQNYRSWSQVQFGQTLTYDYSPDQAELIKDSACAVNRSSWASMYDPCAFRALYKKKPPAQRKRIYPARVVMAFLTSSPAEVEKLIRERDSGKLNIEDHICVQCQKECEINIKGRAFTKQTPPQRLIQVSLEHNITDSIFPYVPEQSMTDSEIRNVQRNLKHVKQMQGESQFVNLDLKKWCLHQRHASNYFLGKMYDELFGFIILYSCSHLFFNGCYILPNHRLCPPDYDFQGNPIEGDNFTSLFIGGMEGMQQKKWTHGGILLIKYSLEKSGMKGEIMGQGDNLVIVLHFKSNIVDKDAERRKFLAILEKNFRLFGHVLKEKETWYSRYLHEYSKQRIYKGSGVSYGLKKSSKVIPDINDGLFSIPSSLSTINTITEGIARADYTSDTAFIINSVNITNFIMRKRVTSLKNREDVLLSLNWPIDFGGLNISNYHSHAVRGNDDKVSIWLSLLKELHMFEPKVYSLCVAHWLLSPEAPASTARNRRNLYEDIYSLNIPPYPSAESTIRERVVNYLKSDEVTNRAIKILYDPKYSVVYDELLVNIDKIRPIYPALGHELLSNSNAGLFLRLQGKLTNSKTLEKAINAVRTEDVTYRSLIELIQDQNEQLIQTLYRRKQNDYTRKNCNIIGRGTSFCTTVIADKLRKLSWGEDLIGVTKPPWQEQCYIIDTDYLVPGEEIGTITVRTSADGQSFPTQVHKRYGPLRNFIGSRTRAKVTKKSAMAVLEKSSSAKALLALTRVKSWMVRIADPNTVKLCDRLIEEKKKMVKLEAGSWDDFEDKLTTTVGGNLFHRFKSSIERDSAMVNNLPTTTGHFEFSSTTMGQMTAGGKDFNIFYQYIYTAAAGALSLCAVATDNLSPMYQIVFSDCNCLAETPNPVLNMVTPASRFASVSLPAPLNLTPMPGISVPELRIMMACIIGRQLASNIDSNYEFAHSSAYETAVGLGDHLKIKDLSLNDVRQVDFKTMIYIAILFSKHARNQMKKSDSLLPCLREDRSYMYLGEVLLECGLIPNLIELSGRVASEHSTVTTMHGVSYFISRNLKFIIQQLLKDRYSVRFYRFGQDSIVDWTNALSDLMYIRFPDGDILGSERRRLKREPFRKRNLYHLIESVDINVLFESKSYSDVTVAWKLADRGTCITTPFSIVPILARPIGDFRFPYVEMAQYQSQRSRDPRGGLRVPQLSFIARPIGAISSAANKVIETLIATGLFQELEKCDGGCMYTLAEGSGSIAAVLSIAFPKLTVAYNTLMRHDIAGRDLVTDVSVPTWSSLRLDPARLVPNNSLIRGQTDITTKMFEDKLLTLMDLQKPVLVTMDAESSEGSTNNIQFVEAVMIPILSRGHRPIFLFKLFHMVPLSQIISRLLHGYDVDWLIYKPMSSNPVGPECYLVVFPINKQPPMLKDCRTLETSVVQYLNTDMALQVSTANFYIEIAKRMSRLIRSVFPAKELQIPHRYSMASDGFCSLLCLKFLDQLMDVADCIHTAVEDEDVNVCIRTKGTNLVLYHLAHDLTFLYVLHTFPDSFCSRLFTLSSCSISNDFDVCRRVGSGYVKICDGYTKDIWATWRDARMYMREIGLHEICRCKAPTRYWAKERDQSVNPSTLFSWQLYSSLLRLGKLINWKLYLSLRREPREIHPRKPGSLYSTIDDLGVEESGKGVQAVSTHSEL